MDGWLLHQPEDLDTLDLDSGDHWEATPAPPPPTYRPPWMQRAACHAVDYAVMADPERVGEAKAVCSACPVRLDCLRYVLDNEDPEGVWGGLSWDERVQVCPICLARKPAEELGCSPGHTLLRLARLAELESLGVPDVAISTRTQPSARTYAFCVLPRGACHSSARAHKEGCRCRASVDALRAERRARKGLDIEGTTYVRCRERQA